MPATSSSQVVGSDAAVKENSISSNVASPPSSSSGAPATTGAGGTLKPPPASAKGSQKPPTLNVKAIKKRVSSAAVRGIKKAAHNNRKFPWTEVHDHVASADDMSVLMEGHHPTSNTVRMTKYELLGRDVSDWLGCDALIDGAKFDGHLKWLPGLPPPSRKVVVTFMKAEIKFDKSTGHVTIKFRTQCAGPYAAFK